MLAFQILVNGKVVRTAGVGPGHRVLATALSWTHHQPNQIAFTLGGIPKADEHLEYNMPQVSIGDEITIRILETDDVDEPDGSRERIDRHD